MTPLAYRILRPAVDAVIPPAWRSEDAWRVLIAIGFQESGFTARRQVLGSSRKWWQSMNGPATSFWQFEVSGVTGVLQHPKVGGFARSIAEQLQYPADAKVIHAALQDNDFLALTWARLLLYTHPDPLPARWQVDAAWGQYVHCWRPGKPHRDRWALSWAFALEVVP